MYTREEAEGRRLKNPFDTITEGIGINRLTENFKLAELDGAFRGTDLEAVEMSRFILFHQAPFSFLNSRICLHNDQYPCKYPPKMKINHTNCIFYVCSLSHLSSFRNPAYRG